MDRITRTLLKNFAEEQGLGSLSDPQAFERFCNYCVVSREYSDTFDVEDVSCGSGDDTGIDGVAIIVNGALVTTEDEVEDLCDTNGYLEATFIFVQAKTSSSFDAADIGTFAFGVKDFISETPRLPRNEQISRAVRIQEFIYSKSVLMSRGKPLCKMYFITTGTWNGEHHLVARANAEVSDIKATKLFRDVVFEPIDADGIQRMYQSTKSKVSAAFSFTNKTILPDMTGVTEAYLGVLPAIEYLRLITDESGGIRRSLFYDNVRDFQDYNQVNKEIRATLESPSKDRFAVLNNGVTLVARSLNVVGNRFHIQDYQIVNGCQTSHVLYNHRDTLTETVYVPIKVIATSDENITNDVIKATNSQTQVKPEELAALTDFEKRLEAFYSTFQGKERLYYERRSNQYNGLAVEKVRIVTRSSQIKSAASMFLDEPHRAGRYYGALLKAISGRLFVNDHDPMVYYTCAFANYKLEFLFRNASFVSGYRGFRYHLLMILRYQIAGSSLPPFNSRKVEEYCRRILEVLWDDDRAIAAFKSAVEIIDAVGGKDLERDTIKTQVYTDNVKRVVVGAGVPMPVPSKTRE